MSDPTASVTININEDMVSLIWPSGRDYTDAERTLRCYLQVIAQIPQRSELVIVNGELDYQDAHRLFRLAEEAGVTTRLVQMRNPGKFTAALQAGLARSRGAIIALLPTYVQSEPDALLNMLKKLEHELDYVASWRIPRVDGSREQSRSRIFNSITRWFSGITLHDINSGLRVMRREVLERIPLYGDLHVFLPVLASRQGFRVGEVPVRHLEERTGYGERGTRVFGQRFLDLLTLFFLIRFTQKPFRFFGSIGTSLLAVSSVMMLILAFDKVMGYRLSDRPLLVLASLLMVVGVQSFSLGLLGELIIFVNAGGLAATVEQDLYESEDVDAVDEHVDSNAVG